MKGADKRQQLVDHYLDFYSLALSMLHDEDDACDAVQEALVRTLVRPLVNNPVSYCYQSVRHIAIDIMRRRLRTTDLGETDGAVDPEQEMLHEHVGEAFKSLPRKIRQAVELHDIDGYTFNEVAAVLRVSKTTARRLVDEGHQKMKKKIEPEL